MSNPKITDRILVGANEACRKANPHIFGTHVETELGTHVETELGTYVETEPGVTTITLNDQPILKPLLNKTEARYCAILESRQYNPVWKQAITLRLDPPFRSYRPDLAYMCGDRLVLVEVKARHRFMRAGIAKAALAAKTYPQLAFVLALWTGSEWKETRLSA